MDCEELTITLTEDMRDNFRKWAQEQDTAVLERLRSRFNALPDPSAKFGAPCKGNEFEIPPFKSNLNEE